MIDRSEGAGLTVALAGHVVLFGLLSVGFLATPNPDKLKSVPIEVSLSDDIGMETTAPVVSHEELAARKSPLDAPVEPDSAPPEPQPEPEPVKPQPTPPRPAPAPAPAPAPRPAKPVPAKSSPPRPQPARPIRPSGGLPDYAKEYGKANKPSESDSITPPASATGADRASFAAAIQRQVQPCANRQVTPGPGAERIRVAIKLRLNRDGSLAAEPTVMGRDGVDDGNRRYVERVDDLAIATFKGCSPLRGLPDELYDVPGGWKSVTLRYKLPG